ncbi:MAG: zinc ribbon domain-containing protein [Elusimicrobiota bacterium]
MDTLAVCPRCASPLKPGDTSCETCGLPLELSEVGRDAPGSVVCMHCGGRIQANETYCHFCLQLKPQAGAALPAGGARKRVGGFSALLSAFFGVGVIVLGTFLYSKTMKEDAADVAARGQESAVAVSTVPAAAVPAAAQAEASTSAAAGVEGAAPAAAAPKVSTETLVLSRVYDLLLLKDRPDAGIVFIDAVSGKRFPATMADKGAFRAVLPNVAADGYSVEVRINGRPVPFLEDDDPPYRTVGLEKRREAAELLRDPNLAHVPLVPSPEQPAVTYDIAIVAP